MTKHTITLDDDYEFELVSISCHSKNYMLCLTINRALNINLKRVDDFEIIKKKEVLNFPFYEYIDDKDGIFYYLISNKSEKGFLISEQKSSDYFLIMKGNVSSFQTNKIETILKKQEIILTAQQIDIASLKSKKNLLF